MVYPVQWEGSFLLKCWLPGIYHKVGKPIISLYFHCSYFIVGESLVDVTELPVSDFIFM